MKILCLHGMGTNSQILEAQIGRIQESLGEGYEFVFVDGEVDCKQAEGTSIFPGPYLCYYDLPSESNVRAAQDYILEIVEDEGPFDGILGFSQGAALAASILLEHGGRSAFKFAVFICATRPWDVKHPRVIDVSNRTSISSYSEFDDVPSLDEEDAQEENSSRKTIQLLSRYEPTAGSRIDIPSAHIVGGQKDPDMKECQALLQLCAEDLVQVVNHESGHMVPRSRVANDRMVDAIMWAIEKSKFQFFG